MLFSNLVLCLTKNICKTVTKNEIKKLMAFTPVSSSDECACVNTVTCKKVFNHNFILKKDTFCLCKTGGSRFDRPLGLKVTTAY